MAMMPPITIIGCGPGSPDYVTPAARNAAMDAQVLAGTPRALGLFPEAAGTRLPMENGTEALMEAVAALSPETRVAVFVTGDTGVASLAALFIRRFGRSRCRLIPGISSVQVAFSRLGLAWSDAEILSAHHLTPAIAANDLQHKDKIAVLAGRPAACAWVADLVGTLSGDWRIFACEDLTLSDEKIREVSAKQLVSASFASRTLLLLVRSGVLA